MNVPRETMAILAGGINENSKPDYQEKLNVLSETIMAIMAGEVNENCKSVSRTN